ncbi:MAG: MAPEG family protein [Thiomicrorhabdus sp.]|nr:MAPEG family protein [Thiomicrorhabdus sp.]
MDSALIYPLFIQVFLTFIIGFLALKSRMNAVKYKQVSLNHFKHNRGKAPEVMLRYNDNFQNQFELPILFYLLISLLLITEINHIGFLIGAWLLVLTRVIHSIIHIKTNHILHRMKIFVAGVLILMTMWIGFIMNTLNLS